MAGRFSRAAALYKPLESSVQRVTLHDMEVLDTDIARLPAENLRVPRAEFVAVWITAERLQEVEAARNVADWYAGGVVETCRWLARASVRPRTGPWRVAKSPVTRRTEQAYPELIEAECVAADRLDMRRSSWPAEEEGWVVGILATLNWAWRRTSGPPLRMDDRATG